MRQIDELFEYSTRSLARRTSRRSLLGVFGRLLTGAALVPLLPIDRSSRAVAAGAPAGVAASAGMDATALAGLAAEAQAGTSMPANGSAGSAPDPTSRSAAPRTDKPDATSKAVTDNPESCEYWKYCAIDGFLCSCCGGTSNSCPPGTAPSPITWIGTCHNPVDGRDYIVSYNDCCGKASCGNCECNRNEREKPMYRPSRNNDLNWCMANADSNYHCSVSVILGVAEQ